jgi:hypothetical protein
MPTQTRISASAMSEIETAFKAYRSAVEDSGLRNITRSTYVSRACNFLRWPKYEFEPRLQEKEIFDSFLIISIARDGPD